MIVGGEEDDMLDMVVGNEFKQASALRSIATNPGFRSVPWKHRSKRPDLIDRRGNGHKLPGHAIFLSIEQGALEPCKLRCTKHRPRGIVSARAAIADLNVAIRAVIDVDEDAVRAQRCAK
jgi:hypothetical protein